MADIKWPRSFRKATELSDDQVGAIIEQLIAELDRRSPDDDLELTGTEDDFMKHEADGIGCHISDPGGGNVEDEGEEETDVCSAHDDGCGPVIIHGHLRWGSEWDGEGDLAPACRYGIDQTRPIGPDNPEAL